ncbi:OmpA family protein [Pseudomonas duriflava]|uniref:OmpA family protein n=1 Tax=Pseudomonas duriflava TaxID=459528 RepID=A0A562QIY5_9PSED|nr:OmpA family protein [Pseudomonas duriflava]TWI56699.1 OmpA family protein [Pseudomonas duriflava]
MNRRPLDGWFFACCLALSAAVTVGCSSSSYVVLVDSPYGEVRDVTVTTPQGATHIDQIQKAISLDRDAGRTFTLPPKQILMDFTPALAAQPKLPVHYLLYFSGGSNRLAPDSEQTLKDILATLRARKPAAVSVIGHTDTLGSADINQQVGLQRAQAVARRLRAQRLDLLELKVASHGERNLLIKTPPETTELRNRRVEVVIR